MGMFSRIGSIFMPAQPAQPRAAPGRPRVTAGLQGGILGRANPYDAAGSGTQEMADWYPSIRPADAEHGLARDLVVARSRDMVRNDGWAAGAVTRILDSTIGGAYRLSATPDYRALARHNPAFDAVWADEFRQAVEGEWRGFSEDVGHYNDLGRELTVTQQLRQAMWHALVDGDGLALSHFRPDRIERGRAKYGTTFQILSPDRLSNPMAGVDGDRMRGGVELDADGAPCAYHVRKADPGAWYGAIESMQWERIDREDPDGWHRVIHFYDRQRAGMHRGVGIFVPVLSRLKMLARYYGVELQAATVASVFGSYITSPYDPQSVEDALTPDDASVGVYQDMRTEFHAEARPTLNGAAMPMLAPGEKIETVAATRPNAGFSPFTHEMLRGVASALNISYEQLTQDYSETNYSSARAAIAETERSIRRRTGEFNSGVSNKLYANWLHEAFEQGWVPLPRNAPDYVDCRTQYARCAWRGPGSGIIDGVKERQAAVLGMDAGLTTLAECATNESGSDWREILDQRAIEVARFKELGLTPPTWAGMAEESGGPATPRKPVAE